MVSAQSFQYMQSVQVPVRAVCAISNHFNLLNNTNILSSCTHPDFLILLLYPTIMLFTFYVVLFVSCSKANCTSH